MSSPGTETSANRRPKQDLTPDIRSAILSALDDGKSPTKIASEFRVSRATVYNTQKRFSLHKTTDSLPKSGRPEKLKPNQKRYIHQSVRRNRQSWKDLIAGLPFEASKTTIKRSLKEYAKG